MLLDGSASPRPSAGWRALRRRGSRRFGLWWASGAALLALAGVVGSTLGAVALAHSDAAQSRRAFVSAAAQIASGLGVAIQREADLTNSTSAFVAMNPSLSQAEFVRWLAAERTHANYPELATVQLSGIVLASELRGYEEHAGAAVRPAGRGAFTVAPAGKRPFYCLTVVGMAWGSLAARPTAWIDACALPGTRGGLLSARNTGAAFYLAVPYLNQNVLEVETPVYRSGATLTSVTARQRAFVGWLGETILPNLVMADALRGHPGTALTVSYKAAGYQAAYSYSHAEPHAAHVTLALSGDWTVRVSGPVAIASVFGETDALGLLLGGSVLSLLLGTLLYVLASGRARARRLVSQRTAQLEHLALHDALTGLPNRVLALDRAEQLLAHARRTGEPVAALYLDVDGFKQINDTFGHAAGDRFLEQFAGRLRDTLREGDTAARLAGDEFLILLSQTLDAGPDLVAERLLERLRTPYDLGEPVVRHLVMGTSIGIAYGSMTSAEQLLADADVALYAAKAAGRNRYAVFESSMQTASQDRLSLEFHLAAAVDNGQLFLVYQPIVELASERIVAVEALLRWRHPTRGVIGPDTFIPIAEQNGQIVKIGRWVLNEASRQVAAWQATGRHLGLSVNVSGRQLDTDELIDDLNDALRTAGLDPASLTLEITETAVMNDPQAAAQRLRAIKALGVQVAIDDFGTGYSSLACLSELPIDVLKIDRSFIAAIDSSSRSAAVIHTLIQLGKTIALSTLAEGIEDDAQLRHLQAERCDYGQGFLFARPMEAERLDEHLRERPDAANPPPGSLTPVG